jgi:hypothetical protein
MSPALPDFERKKIRVKKIQHDLLDVYRGRLSYDFEDHRRLSVIVCRANIAAPEPPKRVPNFMDESKNCQIKQHSGDVLKHFRTVTK